MAVNLLDLSAYVGLTAAGAVTLNMLLGTLMAFRYSPVRPWPVADSTTSDSTDGAVILH